MDPQRKARQEPRQLRNKLLLHHAEHQACGQNNQRRSLQTSGRRRHSHRSSIKNSADTPTEVRRPLPEEAEEYAHQPVRALQARRRPRPKKSRKTAPPLSKLHQRHHRRQGPPNDRRNTGNGCPPGQMESFSDGRPWASLTAVD